MDKRIKKQLGRELTKRQNRELNIEEKKSLADDERVETRSLIPDVAGIVNPKERRVNTYQKYNTYQALFDVYSKEEMSDDELYIRVVYYIVKWIRNRLVQSGLGDKEEYNDFMQIPEVDQIDLFDMSSFENIEPHFDLDVRTYSSKEEGTWTLCLTELGLRQEENFGREFISDVSVTREIGRTVLGIRIACKEPADAEGDAKVMRPAFVRSLWRDSKLVITEHDIPCQFAFRFADKGNEAREKASINDPLIEGSPLEINGNSDVECLDFVQKLVLNENRQLPILVCPIEEYNNNRDSIDHLSQSLMGYCHVVVVKESVNKLFGKIWGRQDYIEAYEKGNFIFHREKAANGMEPYYYPLVENVYEVLRDEIKPFQLKKNYQFGDYCFYTELREKLLRSVGEDTEDPRIQLIEGYKEELNEVRTTLERTCEENDRINNELNDIKSKNDEMSFRITELQRKLKEASTKADALKGNLEKALEDNTRLTDKNNDLKKLLPGGAESNKMHEVLAPIAHIPVSKYDPDGVIDWINKYYGGLLIVHNRAVTSFGKKKNDTDIRELCLMIHYLAGYTMYRNEGGLKLPAKELLTQYDVENNNFAVEGTSSGCGATDIYKDKYTIDISEYNKEKNKVIMDIHMKKGKGQADINRIYFYYDDDIQKTIIGYMPDHLPTRGNPT